MGIDLKIAQLRKRKGVSQQELADYLGVTFQTVSKWETKTNLPDITLLPEIAKYFEVSVDEVLGLVPLKDAQYIERNTDDRSQWSKRLNVIQNNRQFFWNEDYLSFLVKDVWKITQPIDVVEFCCCDADLGIRLMKILPAGSTYTGVDSKILIQEAQKNLQNAEFEYHLIASDVYEFEPEEKYDLSICQASMRHLNHPKKMLEHMRAAVKEDGLVVCVEINREIENDGLYVKGMDYSYLCHAFNWRKLWLKELESEGRDYAIGVRIPFYMQEIGLREVDVRMNDKVTLLTPSHQEYAERKEALRQFRGWKADTNQHISDSAADFYLSRGYKRDEIEQLEQFQTEMTKQFEEKAEEVSLLHLFGLLISYGRR